MNLDNLIDLMNLIERKYPNSQLALELRYCGNGKLGGWHCDVAKDDNSWTGFMIADTNDYEQMRSWIISHLEEEQEQS